jgi:hypothetical protein
MNMRSIVLGLFVMLLQFAVPARGEGIFDMLKKKAEETAKAARGSAKKAAAESSKAAVDSANATAGAASKATVDSANAAVASTKGTVDSATNSVFDPVKSITGDMVSIEPEAAEGAGDGKAQPTVQTAQKTAKAEPAVQKESKPQQKAAQKKNKK